MAINPVECIRPIDSKMIALLDPEDNEKKRYKETQFAFDFVYDKVSSIIVSKLPPKGFTMIA
jgi:hypothetical protein